MGHNIMMADRMAQAGALRPDVTTTVAYHWDEQVSRDQTMGAGHKGAANGTRYHNDRQDGSSRFTTIICHNHSSRLWRRAGDPRSDDGCRIHAGCKWDTV
jgi:hypothetical protein